MNIGELQTSFPRCTWIAGARLRLRRFQRDYAPAVASWVRDAKELFLLAPQTPGPLTAQKVASWCTPENKRQPWLLWNEELDETAGYGELNPLSSSSGHWWIGHFLVAPAARGQGLGQRFARLLLAQAFGQHSAHMVSLVVFPNNLAAIRCYQRAGFRHNGSEQRLFGVSGRVHTLLRMTITQTEYLAAANQ